MIEWQMSYFGQSQNTPLASKRWEEKLNSNAFQNEILDDRINWETKMKREKQLSSYMQ